MSTVTNANEARIASKESNRKLLITTLEEISKVADTGKVNLHISENNFSGGLKLKLQELGFNVGGLITNGNTKSYLVSWE